MRLALAAVAALTLVAAGCGGEDSAKESEPTLAEAIQSTTAAGSARFTLEARGTGTQLGAACEGTVDYSHERMQAACELGPLQLDLLGFGRTAFVRGSREARWEVSSSSEGRSFADLSPEQVLDVMQAASIRSRRLGEDSVRGDSTVRHELTVDCARAKLECAGATVSAEVWVDDDGLVRRISVDDGARNGVLEFFDFGVEVDVEPPPHDQVEVPAGHHFGSYGRGPTTTCTGGGTPISAKMAVAALRRNGLTVSWEEDTRCREGVAAKITNEHEGYQAFEVEGLVQCSLLLESEEDAWSVVIREDGSVGGRGVELELENLHCVIVSGSVDDENVRGFEQAFTELERTIRP